MLNARPVEPAPTADERLLLRLIRASGLGRDEVIRRPCLIPAPPRTTRPDHGLRVFRPEGGAA